MSQADTWRQAAAQWEALAKREPNPQLSWAYTVRAQQAHSFANTCDKLESYRR